MKNFKSKFSILIFIFLTACGGGSSSNNVELNTSSFGVISNYLKGTGNPYDQMIPGSQITYKTYPITTSWDNNTQALTIVKQFAYDSVQTLQYSTTSCNGHEYFVTHYNWGIPTSPQPVPPYYVGSLVDTVFISSNGISYIGEGLNGGGNVTPGEAKISMNPIVGETINEYSTVSSQCINTSFKSYSYHWQYKTIEHFDSWMGFKDVWRTGLVEYNGDGFPPNYYNYYFALNYGMIAFLFQNTSTYPGVNGANTGYLYLSSPP